MSNQTDPPRPPDNFEAEQDFKDRVKTLGNLANAAYEELKEAEKELESPDTKTSVKDRLPLLIAENFWFLIIIFFILIIAVAAFYFTSGSDLLTGLQPDPPSAAVNQPVEPPTHEELMAQEPVELTDGPWRFFGDSTEANALYDIQFEPDGSCYVPGDTVVYGGKYTVEENQIEIELYRRTVATSEDPDGKVHSAEVEWTEWFHMTRAGNTMSGYWEVEGWMFSYENGLEMTGIRVNGPEIFSRPERPEDPG